jgi:hypothetical protein
MRIGPICCFFVSLLTSLAGWRTSQKIGGIARRASAHFDFSSSRRANELAALNAVLSIQIASGHTLSFPRWR